MDNSRQFIQEQLANLDEHSATVRREFGGLDRRQLGWRPNPEKWSIGKLLEHLITTNRTYFPVLESIADGNYKPSLWTRLSPLSGFFGNMLVKQMAPGTGRGMKAPKPFAPSVGEVPEGIVDKFLEHQDELKARIDRLSSREPFRAKIASPASGMITYSLKDAILVMERHEARHIDQALRLKQMPGFPG